jgi:hypothetical protein
MFRDLNQHRGGIHIMISKRASLRESTKDLLAHMVQFGRQDNTQTSKPLFRQNGTSGISLSEAHSQFRIDI